MKYKIFLKKLRHSVLFQWIFSYAVILIVFILSLNLIYSYSQKAVRFEVSNANTGMLKQLGESMDDLLGSIEKIKSEIMLNDKLGEAFKGTVKEKGDVSLLIKDCNRELAKYQSFYSMLDGIYIYLEEYDYVLSGIMGSDTDTFYKSCYAYDGYTYDKWFEELYADKPYYSSASYIMGYDRSQPPSISYICPLRDKERDGKQVTLVILINQRKFLNQVSSFYERNGAAITVIDHNDNVLCSSLEQGEDIKLLPYSSFEGNSGVLNQKIDGKDYILSYTTSELVGWKYIYLIPESIYWGGVRNIRIILILLIILCSVFVAALGIYFSKRNYSPIDKIIRMSEKKFGNNRSGDENEYAYIGNVLSNVENRLKKLDIQLNKQNMVLRNDFIRSWLDGKWDEDALNIDVLNSFDIDFSENYFGIILLNIENSEDLFKDENQGKFEKKRLAHLIVTNVTEELLNESFSAIAVDKDDMIAIVVNTAEIQLEEYTKKIDNIINVAAQVIENEFDLVFSVSVSDIKHNIFDVSSAYEEAVTAMEYKMIMNIEKTVVYSDLKSQQKYDFYYPFDKEQMLINSIKSGNAQEAVKIIEEVFDFNFKNNALSFDIIRCVVFDITSTMIKAVNEISSLYETEFIERINPVNRLVNCANINSMRDEMISIVAEICDFIGVENKSNRFDIKKNAISYIKENYMNPNLSVAVVAEHFNLTPNYVSTIFREQVGEGMLDCIHKTRANAAAEIIIKQNMDIKDVAKMVGYTNTGSFIRIFKKYYGVTPAKYKENSNSKE